MVFASSRDGEERQLLEVLKRFGALAPVPPEQDAVQSIAKRVHDVQWMIVPRHPQRFDEVAALVESHGFAVARRSAAGAPARAPRSGSAIRSARWRCTTAWPTSRCWAAASSRWAGRT